MHSGQRYHLGPSIYYCPATRVRPDAWGLAFIKKRVGSSASDKRRHPVITAETFTVNCKSVIGAVWLVKLLFELSQLKQQLAWAA